MRKYGNRVFISGWIGAILLGLIPYGTSAVEISRVSGVPIKNDIVLSPAKVELSLEQGTKISRYLTVVNRTGQDAIFEISVEDFSPSDDPDGGVVLDKTIIGLQSSLKKYISFDQKSFSLSHGEQARIPITIDLPKNVSPGGLYGAVLVSSAPLKNEAGATKVITRLGSLFFIKINGPVTQAGSLKGAYFKNGRIVILFENGGDIYLNHYGKIKISDSYKNSFMESIDIDPWFVLPKSIRTKIVKVDDLPAGKYIAGISINRGYDDIIDTKELSFEIVGPVDRSFKNMLASILSVSLVLFLYKKFIYAKKKI
jgi:hypothetical protein